MVIFFVFRTDEVSLYGPSSPETQDPPVSALEWCKHRLVSFYWVFFLNVDISIFYKKNQ